MSRQTPIGNDATEPRPRLSRRAWIAAAASSLGIAAGTYAVGIEPRRLTITRHVVGSERGPVLRLVQLSDLHLQVVDRQTERVAEAVHALQPDVLVLTGDVIDRAPNAPLLSDLLALLSDLLALLPNATQRLAILGNWEHWARLNLTDMRDRYERAGFTLLQDTTVSLVHAGVRVQVTGLDDLVGGHPDTGRALADATGSPNHVLLAHCPAHRDAFLADVVRMNAHELIPSFMLGGHTHGGQVALAGWAPMRPPGSGRYVAGWYRDGAMPLYVSRGLGTSLVPARFGAPPEIAVFDWTLTG